jgi:NAD(P)H-nitrite reductase large subunit
MARRHVLIGSGPAAIAAAETIRGLDPAAEITLVCAERHGYYSRPGLAYYLAKEVPESQLFPFSQRELAELSLRLVYEAAVRIDTAAHLVTLASGASLPYDRLLIATGSLAIPVRVPGANLDGVIKLDDMDDARDLIARSRKAKVAVVVGGGITALEVVEGLRERKVHVHYFMRRDRYWSNVLSEAESQIVEDGLRSRGVEIHFYTELAQILGREGRVAAVETGNGERIACDIVAIAIGVHPQIELAREAGLECARGILVDEYLQTSAPDVFAAGDVAEVADPRSGERMLEVLWSSAVVKGRTAGANMATEAHLAYDKGTAPLNVTRLAGFKITIIGSVGGGKADSDLEGLARGDSQAWRGSGKAVTVESQEGDCHIRLLLAENMIVGAVVMGNQLLSFPLQDLVGHRVDLGAHQPQLLEPHAPLARIIESIWQEWKDRHV